MDDEWCGQTLHQFAMYDNHEAMMELLMGDEIRNINAPDRLGRTPVFTAVSNNSIRCLELLLESSANPSIAAKSTSLDKMTPLHRAVKDAKTEAVQLLLQHGADLNKTDLSGQSAMHLVKKTGPPEHIQLFAAEDKKRKQNVIQVVEGLVKACEECDVEKVRDILRMPPPSGFDLANTLLDNNTKSALLVTARTGDVQIMSALVDTATELCARPSVIHEAVQYGHTSIVHLLLQHFPECCLATDDNNQTPLHAACEAGSLEIVKLLMEWRYPSSLERVCYDHVSRTEYRLVVPFNSEDCDNKNAFYLACEYGHDAIVEYLLNFQVKGKRVPMEEDDRDAATSRLVDFYPFSVKTSDVESVSSIDLTVTPNTGSSVVYKRVDMGNFVRSYIYIAVKNKHLQVVDRLIRHGASVELYAIEQDVKYSVLLRQALENTDLLMLNKLLENGATDINNFVFEETVRSKPKFISHFLKYKVSEDTYNSINKVKMRGELDVESLDKLASTDEMYQLNFPKEAVNVRWQNLKVLTTVDQAWLVTVANFLNPAMSNLNARIPLYAITKIDVSNNSLTIVPAPLLQLPSLVSLSAANNEITEFPSERNFDVECPWLEEISIHHNKLTTIPDYIFFLPKLRSLNASNNLISQLPASMWRADFLKSINLCCNRIEHLPKPVFVNSTSSDLERSLHDSYEVFELSTSMTVHEEDQVFDSLENRVIFHDLKRANHWSQNLVVNDDEVNNAQNRKKGIQILKLAENQMKVFPDFLSCCCPHLESLQLQKNKILALRNIAAYPTTLKSLDMSFNCIDSMKSWQEGDDAKKCYCRAKSESVTGSGKFHYKSQACVHRAHTKLPNLESLDLSSNKLTHFIVLRTDKQILSMSQMLKDQESVEEDIQRQVLLPVLTSLHLDNNQFTAMPSDIKQMKTLRILSLKQNFKLKELPPSLGLLDGLQRISLQMCPLEGPIQDIIKGASSKASDITGFLRSVLEEAVEYNCMNLMIVGSFNIGKTSLMKHLMKIGKGGAKYTHFAERQDTAASSVTREGDPLSTVGIDISQLILDGKRGTVDFRVWDFAGQKEYYATHQYFLSPRSLYLVVWNMTTGEPGIDEMKQWLVNIQAQAKGSAVIIIGTHLDEIRKRQYPRDWEASMTSKVREKYQRQDNDNSGLPYVMDVINVAAGKSPKNIDTLKNRIYERVFQLKHPARRSEKLLGHKVPKKYLKLQKCIAKIAETRRQEKKAPVLDTSSYLLNVMEEMSNDDSDVCFRNIDDLNQATRFLHENGVICHFEDSQLKNQYFLEPQWLCDQLAKVVTVQEVQSYASKGVMSKKNLCQMYKNADKISMYILSLLNKFEVALAIDSEQLILPSLLPTHRDISNPDIMTKIPLNRKADVLNGSQSSTLSEGDMFIACTKPDNKAAFSNTRLYLLTYFPSGFWPRLITRVLADESFFNPVINLYNIPQEMKDTCPDIQRAVPSWRCWQTGFELVYFDNVIMQVKEVYTDSAYGQGMCNYADEGLNMQCYFDSEWTDLDINDSAILEISFRADKITFNLGVNAQISTANQDVPTIEQREIYHDEKMKTGVLAKIVEHIDNLLQDWFPDIGESRFSQTCLGRYLITRVIPCPLCLQAEINFQASAAESWDMVNKNSDDLQPVSIVDVSVNVDAKDCKTNGEVDDTEVTDIFEKRTMCSFLVEKCIKNVLEGMDEICKVHKSVSPLYMPGDDGTMRVIHIAPDAVFHDLDVGLLIGEDILEVTEEIGRGAFGTVFAGKLRRNEHTVHDVAMKVLHNPDRVDKRRPAQTSQASLETICAAYTNARQEVSILQTVEHPHIVPLLGLSRRPLALLLSKAPLGSLNTILENRHKDGLRLAVCVIKQIVIQVTDALDYLHNKNIIYRDLKSDNVLVWNFPSHHDLDPKSSVLVKLADYGISKSVYPTGEAKGYGGTPPFIAPEILIHSGRDTYTEKVDMFSFGMFMFELLTCRLPLAEVVNITLHVAHGGRPTLTTEEAVYPSHMLDVMTMCWSHDPHERPSAAQVRTIATTPQFCHLTDAVTMETESTVLSATSVFVESSNVPSNITSKKSDHSQVWMVSLLQHDPNQHKVDVLSYDTNNRCIATTELKHDLRIVAVCNVDSKVWCLDSHGVIHVYCPLTFEKLCNIPLQVRNLEQVQSMSYHPETGGHTVILLKEWQSSTTLFCLSSQHASNTDQYKPVKIIRHCCSAVPVQSDNSCKLWIGADKGEILVRDINKLDEDGQDKLLSPFDMDGYQEQKCKFIAHPVNMPATCHLAWTYIYPGSKVLCWDTDKDEIIESLDCSKILPKIEWYNMQKMARMQANHFQVTALLAFGQFLYTSTTWGCVIVADARTMRMLSVFRCHGKEEFYCKSILPIGPLSLNKRKAAADVGSTHKTPTNDDSHSTPWSGQDPTHKAPVSDSQGNLGQGQGQQGLPHSETILYERQTSGPGQISRETHPGMSNSSDSSSGVVTVGRGYIDVIRYVRNLHKEALNFSPTMSGNSWGQEPSEDHTEDRSLLHNTHILSWQPYHWNYF